MLILAVSPLALGLQAATASAGQVQQIANFGDNPSGIGMYLYTPSNVVAKPPILVVPHACHGKGTDVCQSGNAFAQQADKYGFLLICPSAISSDGCWDVHSTAVLAHDGGGDASGIVSMVNYVVQNLNGDASRIYVAGHSSGGMMTDVLLGSYPDVFKAGAAYAGVPFACFAQGSVDSLGWNSSCATGEVTKTAAQWGDLVRAAYPDFTGMRPRMQLWHGTNDETVNFTNFGEEVKQWTNVLGVSETPASTENNALQSTWIRTRYADGSGAVQVEAIQETGQPHNLVVDAAEAIRFFGLDGSNPVPDAGARDGATDFRAGTGGAGSGTGGTALGGNAGSGGRSGGSGGSGGVGTAAAGAGGSGGGDSAVTGAGGTGGSTVPIGSGGVGAGGGVGGNGGNGSAAGTGGSTVEGTSPAGGRAAGCSCRMGKGGRAPTGGGCPVWLALALGFHWRSRRRSTLPSWPEGSSNPHPPNRRRRKAIRTEAKTRPTRERQPPGSSSADLRSESGRLPGAIEIKPTPSGAARSARLGSSCPNWGIFMRTSRGTTQITCHSSSRINCIRMRRDPRKHVR